MAWQAVTDKNDGQSFDGATWQSAIDAIEELQDVIGAAETVSNALVARGTYTPSLTNVTLAGDGTNGARYVFIGHDDSSDYGVIAVNGQIELGTGGALTGLPTIALPSGFQFDAAVVSSLIRPGRWSGVCAGTTYDGVIGLASSTTVAPYLLNASSTYLTPTAVSGTVPGTWTSANFIRYTFSLAAVRT